MAETRQMIDTKLVGLAKVKVERLTPAFLDGFYGADASVGLSRAW